MLIVKFTIKNIICNICEKELAAELQARKVLPRLNPSFIGHKCAEHLYRNICFFVFKSKLSNQSLKILIVIQAFLFDAYSIGNKNVNKLLRKFSVNFQNITILAKILKKLHANFSKISGRVKFFF